MIRKFSVIKEIFGFQYHFKYFETKSRGERIHFTCQNYWSNLRKKNGGNLRFPKANLSLKVIGESFHVIESCSTLNERKRESIDCQLNALVDTVT